MIGSLLKRFSGSHYRKFLKQAQPVVARINAFEEEYQGLSVEQLRAKTEEFRARYRELVEGYGEPRDEEQRRQFNQDALEAILPEAFAAVKNAARRLCGQTLEVCGQQLDWEMIHYDVQLIGGYALHHNRIAEMATGEGKTLAATLPLYLNALTGRNCQLVTHNEYLARRDAEWMGYIYKMLGLTVGVIQNGLDPAAKREMYGCDITYGSSSEFGFDYLRDNGMAGRREDQVQRDHYYCIVDEIDSILVDEARTPLIISGPVQVQRELPFVEYKPAVERLVRQQHSLCNRLMSEVKNEIAAYDQQEKSDPDREAEILTRLLQVKLGMPKNKVFMRLLEEGPWRKKFERFETEMSGDFNKERRYALKEELFYTIDEKQHVADLTENGRVAMSPDDADTAFVLPDLGTQFADIDRDSSLSVQEKAQRKAEVQQAFEKASEQIHTISQLLRAYSLYDKDDQYIVKEGKVQIIDENTGRVMPGRRWSDGLHQAVEAKEGVAIEKETKTFATITIQNYFRMYDKLAGMTGTAETEATEFFDIYKLKVMVIPTHRPIVRDDLNDVIFKTRREKFNAVVEEIREAHDRGQPVLVGTASVEASELLSRMLKRQHIPHSVLNAKFHEREAEIIARAGQLKAVTIATNMAGRGTDIKLGQGVKDLGGLYVIGTERHQSRRIDRQLRGRSGRQGDPGKSRFFVSLEDDLMRLFANAGPISSILEKSFKEGEVLEHPLLNRSIQNAQKKVEQHNYSIRKRLLEYDDVLNRQREVIYDLRNDALHSEAPREIVFELIEEELEVRIADSGMFDDKKVDQNELHNFVLWLNTHFPIGLSEKDLSRKDEATMRAVILDRIREGYANRESVENPEALVKLERFVVIRAIDKHWQSHLTEMEELRQGVSLRAYGQKDPLQEYKGEAYRYFEEMMKHMRTEVATGIFRSATNMTALQNLLEKMGRQVQMQGPAHAARGGAQRPARPSGQGTTAATARQRRMPAMAGSGGLAAPAGGSLPRSLPQGQEGPGGQAGASLQTPAEGPVEKVGRNDPCPCGSGKKYKNCHGRA